MGFKISEKFWNYRIEALLSTSLRRCVPDTHMRPYMQLLMHTSKEGNYFIGVVSLKQIHVKGASVHIYIHIYSHFHIHAYINMGPTRNFSRRGCRKACLQAYF
jgi:hypothetical protein